MPFFAMRKLLITFFFGCVIAIQIWCNISELVGLKSGDDFISIGKLRLFVTKSMLLLILSPPVPCGGLWKLRNFLCFQNGSWKDVQSVLHLPSKEAARDGALGRKTETLGKTT